MDSITQAAPEPTPVTVISAAVPIPVVVTEVKQQLGPTGMPRQSQMTDPSVPAKTTFQEDLTTEGQRRINVIWENTQAVIALLVIFSNMVVGVIHGIWGIFTTNTKPEFPVILSSSLFLVVGFYFSRTNHAAVGGVGKKAVSEYTGR